MRKWELDRQRFAAGFHRHISGEGPVLLKASLRRLLGKNVISGNSKRTVTIDGVEYVIPDGITLLEYIQTVLNSTYSIATNITAQETDKIIVDANIDAYSATGDKYLIAASNSWVDIAGNGVTWFVRFGSSSSAQAVISGGVGQRNIHELYKQHFDINGTTKATPDYSSIRGSWYIFAPFSYAQGAPCKMYSYKIINTNTNEVRFSGMPAKNSSNVLGMYDFVTGTFLPNAGRGEFIAGPELPTPEQPLGVKGVGEKTENLTSYILNVTSTGDGTSGSVISSLELNVNWEENAQYTFLFDCFASGVTFSVAGNLMFFIIRYTDGTSSYQGIDSNNYQQGRISFTTSPSKTIYAVFSINKHARWTGGTVTICNLSIVKGSTAPTEYIPYGYKVTERVSGVNLFNPDNANTRYPNGWYSSGGAIENSVINNRTIIIPCSEGDVFTFKHYAEASGARYFWIYSDAVAIGEPCSAMYGTTISINAVTTNPAPSNAKYIGICFWRVNGGTVQSAADDFVIVKGSTAPTTYIPYIEPTTYTAYIDKPLGKVGTYADTFDFASGVHTESVGEIVFDGTESVVKDGSRYYHTLAGMLNEGSVRSANICCTHFKTSTTGTQGDIFKFGAQVYMYPDMTLCPDATAFKAFLAAQYAAGTPVTVWYPKATPTTTQHTAVPVTPADGDDYVESSNEVKGALDVVHNSRCNY